MAFIFFDMISKFWLIRFQIPTQYFIAGLSLVLLQSNQSLSVRKGKRRIIHL